MSSQLNGHQTAMGSTQRDTKLLTVVALSAVLVAVLSIAGLKTAVSSPADTPVLASSPLAAKPAAQPAAPAAAPAAPAPAAAPATTTIAAPTKAATKTVMIMNYKYSPATLTVNVGDTVTWTNMDTAPHTVTVTNGPVKFDSGTMQKGETFSYTFKEAGTYEYYCAVHPDMVASVTVAGSEPEPTEEPTPTEEPSPTEEPTGMPMPEPDACEGLNSAVDTFMVHFNAAHLETSLGQQIAEALALDQYALTHTILIKNMLAPLLGGLTGAADTFMQHVYAAHLETSPGQQVAEALAIDQYAKTHTVMIANMLKPLLGSDLSSC